MTSPDPLRIALVSAEAAPFAKTGGLGDAVAGLTRFLFRAGHDARLFLPLYSSIDTEGKGFEVVDYARDVPLRCGPHELQFSLFTAPLAPGGPWAYFIHCPPLYDRKGLYTGGGDDAVRMSFLSRAALASCQRMGWSPQVIHCHDWHAALVPVYLKTHYAWDGLFSATRTLLTVHNLGYQGIFGSDALHELELSASTAELPADDLAAGTINFLKTGILRADFLSTVSPTHAREIQTAEYGSGLDGLLRLRVDSLRGILNGVDLEEWDPTTDQLIFRGYSAADLSGKEENKSRLLEWAGLPYRRATPLAGIVTRLTKQKGIELFFEALPWFLANRDVQIIALGSGERRYEEFFTRLQESFPGKAWFFRGYNNQLAHRIEAGADLFLMPSLYEPCGLNQMYSLRYGTVPVVRKTGGLADSVELYDWEKGTGTGFLFEHFNQEGLTWALGSALETFEHPEAWRGLQLRGMEKNFSWDVQGQEYVELYRRLAAA